MVKLEKEEEAKVRRWCDNNGVLFIKFSPMGARGWPDRVAVFPGGVHVWTELKRKGRELAPLQEYRARVLTKQGCLVAWFDDADECIAFYESMLGDLNELSVDA
jgi:hypothetical protein